MFVIKFPNNFSNPARRKNRNPRARKAITINNGKLRPKKPLAIVIILNGKGVKPALKTIQIPQSLQYDSKLVNWLSKE